ncbi:endonuclease [Methanocaldococcus infernus]
MKIYEKLLNTYGYQNWWPAETRFEVIIGSILVQGTQWSRVEKVIEEMKKRDLIDEEKILKIDEDELINIIRKVGYYKRKARALKELTGFIVNNYGSTDEMAKSDESLISLREKLLSIKGIGKETADSILLYALDRETFVVNAYTKRLFGRLNIIHEKDYEKIKRFFESQIPRDLKIYKEYNALIVEHCKRACRKVPKCLTCPLKNICPYSEGYAIKEVKG